MELALRNQAKGYNDEKMFKGKLMFHQPLHAGSTPSALDPVLRDNAQVEVSYDVPELRTPRCELHVVLDDIRSQWNVGSIFRTADAAGWDQVVLTGITASPPSAGVMKCALGATEFVNWQVGVILLERGCLI